MSTVRVKVLLKEAVIATEEFDKASRMSHIVEKLVVKYGQIVSFNVIIPPVLEEENRNEAA